MMMVRSVSSWTAVLAIVLAVAAPVWAAQPASAGADPDALYAKREDMTSAMRAADVWEHSASTSYEAAWKLARACYWLGSRGPADGRRAQLERGIAAGENALRLADNRPEGHFWLAVNMGRLAQSAGLRQGLKYRGRIKSELERALTIDPGFQNGSADAVLGEWYRGVPRLLGGSRREAEAHFRRALDHDPANMPALQYLAQFLEGDGRVAEARVLWQRLLDEPIDAEWAPEGREFRRIATDHLARLQTR
jgi:tetratricopeptide (TPR) repeat protein